MSKTIVIRNQHTDKDGFLMVSDQVPDYLQEDLAGAYRDQYRWFEDKFKVNVLKAKITYNEEIDMYERRIKIRNVDSEKDAKAIVYSWVNSPEVTKIFKEFSETDHVPDEAGTDARQYLVAHTECSLDIYIVDDDNPEKYIYYSGKNLFRAKHKNILEAFVNKGGIRVNNDVKR